MNGSRLSLSEAGNDAAAAGMALVSAALEGLVAAGGVKVWPGAGGADGTGATSDGLS